MDIINLNFLQMIRRAEELAESRRIHRDAGRDKTPADGIAQACLQETGLPFSVVQHSSPEALSDLLHRGSNFYERATILAELLVVESELNEAAGDLAGKVRAQLQAFCLLGESMGVFTPEEQKVFRQKLDLLAGRLREAGDDPYLKQKLRQFGC